MVCQFEFKVISGHLVWLRKSLSKHFMIDRNPCKQLKNNQFYSSFMFKKKKQKVIQKEMMHFWGNISST